MSRLAARRSPSTRRRGKPVPVESVAVGARRTSRQPRPRKRTVTIDGAGRTRSSFPPRWQQQMELRTLADWVVRPRLLKIPGVAEVFMQGGDRKQYQVLVDPDALLEYDVTLQEVEAGPEGEQHQHQRRLRRAGRDRAADPHPRPAGPGLAAACVEDLRKVPVKDDADRAGAAGATWPRSPKGRSSSAATAASTASPGVVFTIAKQPHVDTRALTDEIDRGPARGRGVAAGRHRHQLRAVPAQELHRPRHLQRRRGAGDRGRAGLIILFLFLLNFRTTFITLTAIPLSLVVTTLVFRADRLPHRDGAVDQRDDARRHRRGDGRTGRRRDRRRRKHLPPARARTTPAPNPQPALRVVYEASKEIRTRHRVRHGGRDPGVPAAVRPVRRRGPAVRAAGRRLHRVDPGVAGRVADRHAGAVATTCCRSRKATHRDGDGPLLRLLKWAAGYLIRFSMARPGMLLLLTWVHGRRSPPGS